MRTMRSSKAAIGSKLYLQGFSTSEIARELKKLNIPTKCGKEIWRPSHVAYILRNERYIGDSFYQKT